MSIDCLSCLKRLWVCTAFLGLLACSTPPPPVDAVTLGQFDTVYLVNLTGRQGEALSAQLLTDLQKKAASQPGNKTRIRQISAQEVSTRGLSANEAVIAGEVIEFRVEDRPTQTSRYVCDQYEAPPADASGLKKFMRKCVSGRTVQESCTRRTAMVDLNIRITTAGGLPIKAERISADAGGSNCSGATIPTETALVRDLREQVSNEFGRHVNFIKAAEPSAQASNSPAPSSSAVAPPTPVQASALNTAPATLEAFSPQTPAQEPSVVTPNRKVGALVIGNSRYQSLGPLKNPGNDADAMSARLKQLGITTELAKDLTRTQMVERLSRFAREQGQADITLLFYAGHGIQIDGVNYLIPVDMPAEGLTAADAKLWGIPLDTVMEYLPSATRLVFLDACRDNPLSRSLRGARNTVGNGLAPVNAPVGTLISFATRDGAIALDGDRSRNSPFTEGLLAHLGDPDDIAVVLRRVRDHVMRSTQGRQQPWEYGSLSSGALILSRLSSTPGKP